MALSRPGHPRRRMAAPLTHEIKSSPWDAAPLSSSRVGASPSGEGDLPGDLLHFVTHAGHRADPSVGCIVGLMIQAAPRSSQSLTGKYVTLQRDIFHRWKTIGNILKKSKSEKSDNEHII